MVDKKARTVEDNICSIRELLVKSVFIIGDYQRSYQWKHQDRKNLLEDILDKRTPIGNAHFIGLIITHSGAENASGIITHRIIDGQQRITTLVLFFCAIELELKKLSGKSSSSVTYSRLIDDIKNQVEAESGLPRLTSQDPVQDKEIQDVIYENIRKTNSYRYPLLNCRKLIREKLKNEITVSGLRGIFHSLLSCKMLLLPSRTISNPYTLFNTINDRGEELKPADLFKCLTIDLCKTKPSRERAAELWRRVNKEHINADLKSWNVLRTGIKPTPKKTFDSIQKTFTTNSKPGLKSLALLSEIENVSNGIGAVRQSNIEAIKQNYANCGWTNSHIRSLYRELNIREALPLIYAAAKTCKTSLFEKILITTLRVSLRLLKAKTEANRTLPVVFHKYTNAFWVSGGGAYNAYKKSLVNLIDHHCDDSKFEQMLNDLSYETDKSTIKQVLIGIEESMPWLKSKKKYKNHIAMIDKSRIISGQAISLEHLSAKSLDEDKVNLLGNLTLMGGDPNSLMGHDPMKTKKILLKHSPYEITRDVTKKKGWDDKAIEHRQKDLIEFAKRAFRPI